MRTKHIFPYMDRLWTTDVGLTTLVASLLVYIFVLIPLGEPGWVRFLTNICFSIILVAGAATVSKNRILRMLVYSWGLLTFVFIWVRYLFPQFDLHIVNLYLALVFLFLLSVLILGQMFREGPTTSHRIMGGVAVYLILGVIWFIAYYLIALQMPQVFSFQGFSAPGDSEALKSHLFYFSFVTLTTIGYGDIVAAHPMVRMLVILEGVVGQLFPAILIARLVSLQLQSKQKM